MSIQRSPPLLHTAGLLAEFAMRPTHRTTRCSMQVLYFLLMILKEFLRSHFDLEEAREACGRR